MTVIVAEFSNRFQAELVVELLKSFGIEGRLHADDCGGVAPGQSFVRGVRVCVSEEDAAAAIDIIEGDGETED